jgi:hypothetical protein
VVDIKVFLAKFYIVEQDARVVTVPPGVGSLLRWYGRPMGLRASLG